MSVTTPTHCPRSPTSAPPNPSQAPYTGRKSKGRPTYHAAAPLTPKSLSLMLGSHNMASVAPHEL
ncbi:hypothetical protein P154DRAFT_523263 [Amniculicola lignicola CBS 123094]|uniref:Uncharacterized protein n=1 Tax=Amniculicola lignicola CBS 123094 TaxID=1392246 RepID=A0A6A5WEY2_9PLEO|nr:hypothetical protein P154DRAFT_523263 [Amniculicola lignicola CBS 123094]